MCRLAAPSPPPAPPPPLRHPQLPLHPPCRSTTLRCLNSSRLTRARPTTLPYHTPAAGPQWTSFHGQLCLRLQNFGSREGYAAALLGPDPCSAASSAVAEELAWGPAAAFTLDCAPPASGDAAGGDGATATAPAAGAAGGLAQQQQQSPPPQGAPSTAYTWGREVPPAGAAPASQRSSHCQLSVASSSGRGALLQQAFQRPLLGPPINALSVRLCNM